MDDNDDKSMANPYFGAVWNPNIAKHHPQAPTPVGTPCMDCKELIVEGDQGFIMPCGETDESGKLVGVLRPTHLECFLRHIYGSVGHQKKTCSCYGGTEEDPPGMTKREAAKASVAFYESQFLRGAKQ